MEPAPALGGSLKDVKWSSAAVPLDLLVSTYRLPQIARLDSGECVEGLRENDYLLIHSCRQWTTITAHSLEEGHYVIGPKIEIPVHYAGQFKLLEQDRDIKEPVQYFNSVEEVAKAFPERVYVMEEITFNVKVASGECNEDTEVYNITLCTGDELTLMGQAEILYAKTFKEKSRLNTIFKKIGKLNSISKLGKGKMPCLICMNHRTNESISLPFQCKGRFSTRSPLELQMQEGEHTIRNIVEKTRLPVNVTVPSPPPRNPYDLHFIREGHRYKFVNIQTKTVVVCCVLRNNKILPMHFPLHLTVPKFSLPEHLVKGDGWPEALVQHWLGVCQEQFDIDEYSRAVRDVKTDWNEDCKSPKKGRCSGHNHVPSSLSYARDELTQSFHRLSVCVYGNNLHGNSEVNLHGCRDLGGDWAPFPHDILPYQDSGDSGSDYLFPEANEESTGIPGKSELPYEELWLEEGKPSRQPLTRSLSEKSRCDPLRGSLRSKCATSPLPVPGTPGAAVKSSEIALPPPPVPPKSEAVREECRLLNAPPVPPRSAKPLSASPSIPPRTAKPVRPQTRSPSPTLSYYSSGLHNINVTKSDTSPPDSAPVSCYPCNRVNSDSVDPKSPFGSPSAEALSARLSWPNHYSGASESQTKSDFLLDPSRSYSYPRQKTPSTPKRECPATFDFDGCELLGSPPSTITAEFSNSSSTCPKSASYSLESSEDSALAAGMTKQSVSCPALPPRAPKPMEQKATSETSPLPLKIDGAEEDPMSGSLDLSEDQYFVRKGMQDIFSVSHPFSSPLHLQLAPRSCGDGSPWQPPADLSGLSIEEVSKSLRFIGLSEDIIAFFVTEKIDGNLPGARPPAPRWEPGGRGARPVLLPLLLLFLLLLRAPVRPSRSAHGRQTKITCCFLWSHDNFKMAELFMECEEEELEPWQKKVKEVEEDDDDEPIFVAEIASSKPAISNILNRVNPSSYSRGIKNGALSRGITASFKPISQRYMNLTSNPGAASPVNFLLESRSSDGSGIFQPFSKAGYITNSSRVLSNNSSELLFDLTQDTGLSHYQGGPTLSVAGLNESSFSSKRPSASEINSVNPKKPKPGESVPGTDASAVIPSDKSPSLTAPQALPSQGTDTSSNQSKNGTTFPRACPKCNIHFNLLDPLKNHMMYCCPDMINNFLGLTKTDISNTANETKILDSEKGKLIMLVNDFYYGKHEGDVQEGQKTHTTFKCFSCLKVLKNNIRFMNHMKHHLELEKQSTESWESHTTCQHCYRQFPTPFQLQCHIESTHTPHEFSTICKICELSFETEQILLQHMKDNHKPGEMPYICQVCNYRSSSFSDVENHFRTSHENTKNLLCPFCLKVIKIATPYMHHYMKHQKKGIHRCTKCRLQFLTCKEKMDHKTQHHRTFIKPKQLEGLPPGTKVTIRASVGPLSSGSSATPSVSTSTSTLQLSPPRTENTPVKNPTKLNISKPNTPKLDDNKLNENKSNGNKSKGKSKISNMQKKQSTVANNNRKYKVNTALRNLRLRRGVHECIECCSEVKDFAIHFPTYVHCSFCRYNTSCSKAYVNHMMSFHSNRPSKRFCIFKTHSENLRGISLVCLNCDFLTDVSGLDNMATHLSQHEAQTCRVQIEKVSVCIPTSDHLSEFKNEAPTKGQESVSKETARHNTAEGEIGASNAESKQDKAPSSEEKNGCGPSLCETSATARSQENVKVSDKDDETSSKKVFSHDSSVRPDKMEKEKQMQQVCQEMELKMGQSSESTVSCHQNKEARFSSRDPKDMQLTSADVHIDQFLRKRGEPEYLNSDASEQGSVHLEPLTPSELLESEATEILHKDSSDLPAKTDQTDGIPGENCPSITETTVDIADKKERH